MPTSPVTIRPLTPKDIPQLAAIRPGYRSETIFEVERLHDGFQFGWRLTEKRLTIPFDKGHLYDFTPSVQDEIRGRLALGENGCEWVATDGPALIGILDAEYKEWNNTVFIWNLMIDEAHRGRGIGRALWACVVDYGRARGARAITLETQQTNVPACRFYHKMGCQLVGLDENLYANITDQQAPLSHTTPEIALFWAFRLH